MPLTGPKKKPQDFVSKGETWFHIVVNDVSKIAKAFDSEGKKLWELPALARGQDDRWTVRRGDTPPGLYKIGQVYRDYDELGNNPGFSETLRLYGWYSFDLIDLENQESKVDRSGIMLHGGGSACGWPGAWDPYQYLYATHGCIRMHNKDLRDAILPLTEKGTVFISVWQDQGTLEYGDNP